MHVSRAVLRHSPLEGGIERLTRDDLLGLKSRRAILQPFLDFAEGAIVERRQVPAIRRREDDNRPACLDRVHKGAAAVDGGVVEDDDRAWARVRVDLIELSSSRDTGVMGSGGAAMQGGPQSVSSAQQQRGRTFCRVKPRL